MARVPGGEFQMGSARFYPEERPVHRVTVPGFWMDSHPVTVAEFRRGPWPPPQPSPASHP